MPTQLNQSNIQASALADIESPRITAVETTDSGYTVTGGNLSVSGGYVKITGSNFVSGLQVLVDRTPASSISVVSGTQLNVAVGATAAGTYSVLVVNPNGAFGLKPNAISFS